MDNIFSIDVEDWFHILDVPSSPPLEQWNSLESRVERNFLTLLDLLDKHDVKATCFFLGWVGERFPRLVKEADRRGHEIASHGYSHRLVYTQTSGEFGADIKKTKHILEQAAGKRVCGYRAAGFSIVDRTPWALEELAAAGYEYDSSIFPAPREHGGMPGARKEPHLVSTKSGNLLEFPISVDRLLGRQVCFSGGGYLRLFPYWLIDRMGRDANRQDRPVIYYIHPREIDPSHPRLPMRWTRRFKTYVNLPTTFPKLEALLGSQRFSTFAAWRRSHPVAASAAR